MPEIWRHHSVLIGAEPIQVNRRTGLLEYPAVQITFLGARLSFVPGLYLAEARRPEGSSAVHLLDDGHFKMKPHLRGGTLQVYAALLQLAASMEQELKITLARANADAYKEIGRNGARAPRNQQRRAG